MGGRGTQEGPTEPPARIGASIFNEWGARSGKYSEVMRRSKCQIDVGKFGVFPVCNSHPSRGEDWRSIKSQTPMSPPEEQRATVANGVFCFPNDDVGGGATAKTTGATNISAFLILYGKYISRPRAEYRSPAGAHPIPIPP